MTAFVTHLNEVAAELTQLHNGLVFTATGDIVAAAFHRAGDAASYAADLHSTMAAEPTQIGIEIGVGVGLHTGDTEETTHGYYGPAVNLASQLGGAARPSQILVSEATSRLLDDSDLRYLGTYRLDGIGADQRLFQLDQGEHRAPNLGEGREGNLPRRLRQLVGRDQDVAVIVDALAASPLVTLVGPGGIGKTSLAVTVAQRAQAGLADGAWMIELAEITSPDDVPLAVADCLGVKETPGRTLTESLVSVLQTRQMLLVLDNCEHVVDSVAELAAAIAAQSPDVRLLATSRESLGVPEERRIAVAPLDSAGAAAELFNIRAAAASPSFDPDAHSDAIVEICRRLDGIPLAIELAAARIRTLAVVQLLDRLDKRLRLLGGDQRAGNERHRTLWAVVHWSYDLLTPAQQMLFTDLSVFAGSFDLRAAETIAADIDLDAIDIDRLLTGQGEVEGVTRLAELWPNLRSAFDWAGANDDHALAYALVRPIAAEVVLRSRQEIGDWLERVLAITPRQEGDAIVFCLSWTARRYSLTQNQEAYEQLLERYGEPDHPVIRHARAFLPDRYEDRAELARQASTVLRHQGDGFLAELAEIDVGASLLNVGRYEQLDRHLTALLDRYRSEGPPTCLNWTLMLLGYSATFQDDPDRADHHFEEAVRVDVPHRTYSPNKPIEARTLFRQGEHTRAFRVLRANIDDLLDTDNMQAASITCLEFINMMAALDRLDAAADMLAYLEGTSLLDAPGWRTLIADAATKVADNEPDTHPVGAARTDLDDRQALQYMRGILDQLAAAETLST